MKKSPLFIVALLCCTLLCTACAVPATDVQTQSGDNSTLDARVINDIVLKIKEIQEFSDKEILDINKPVLADWQQSGSYLMIIQLDDKGDWIIADYISLLFDGTPTYDLYGKGGPKAYFVEDFMSGINEKRQKGLVLNSFILKDLIVTLEFSDGSKVVFDRYYKEIEENLEKYNKMLYQPKK